MTEFALSSLCKSFPPTRFGTPHLIGSFALTENREWIEDANPYLQVYNSEYWKNDRLMNNPLDLNEGKLIVGGDDFFNEGISPILEWIYRHPELPRTDFVCSRGSLATLMRTPYERNEPWIFTSIIHNGTIYLKVEETEYSRKKEEEMANMSHFFEWGYKFEQHLTETSGKKLSFCNTDQEYHAVYCGVVDDMVILYAAETDAALDSKERDPLEFVEIKLSKKNNNHNSFQRSLKYKSIRWWSQSYLAGINTIVCGLRDDNGVVREKIDISVNEIPKWRDTYWNQNMCLGSMRNILKTIKNKIVKQPGVVYQISCCPQNRIIYGGATNLKPSHILPHWYSK